MHNIFHRAKCVAFTLCFAAGMTGFAFAQSNSGMNQANSNSNNSNISQAQRQLKQKGFYSGRVDGIDGPKTRMAIRRYQRSEGLNQSGNLDQATMSSMGLSNMPQNSQGEASRSAQEPQNQPQNTTSSAAQSNQTTPSGTPSAETIRAAQQKLASAGFYSGKVDGVMNQGTRNALRQYQKANNLPQTGRLTQQTAQQMGISTANGNYESQSPLEQLGKGIAEGAKSHTNNNTRHHRQ